LEKHMTFVTTVLAEAQTASPPVPTFFYGLLAFVVFAILAAVVWAYRDVANRHSAKAEAYAAKHGGVVGGGH